VGLVNLIAPTTRCLQKSDPEAKMFLEALVVDVPNLVFAGSRAEAFMRCWPAVDANGATSN